MALPQKPTASATSTEAVAPVTTETVAPAAKPTGVLKRFGAARTGEGENSVAVPTPTAAGADLVELSKQLYTTVANFCNSKQLKLEDVLGFCADADKSQFPGHKDGRVAYATAGMLAGLGKINGLLNKVRGLGGGAAMKAKIAEKDQKIADLEKKLAEVLASMGAK
jgi:hypothetical protein